MPNMISNAEHEDNLTEHAVRREKEKYDYQVNIDNYTAMLAALPADAWPAHIAQYATKKIDEIPLSVSQIDVDAVVQYQLRDRLQRLLRTERAEQLKASTVLQALKTQIGPQYDAKRDAKMAALKAAGKF